MSELTKVVTDASFQFDVLESKGPVLVDFWAEWCGPCKIMTPMVDEIASTYSAVLTVAKLNIDDSPSTVQRYEVMSVPTFALFVDGELVKRVVGAKSKAGLLRELDVSLP